MISNDKLITLSLLDYYNTKKDTQLFNLKSDLTDLINETRAEIEKEFPPETEYKMDDTAGSVEYTFKNNEERTFSSEVSSLKLTIPEDIQQGFMSCLHFNKLLSGVTVFFDNKSNYNLRLIKQNTNIPSFTTSNNNPKLFFAACDGINIEILIVEEL